MTFPVDVVVFKGTDFFFAVSSSELDSSELLSFACFFWTGTEAEEFCCTFGIYGTLTAVDSSELDSSVSSFFVTGTDFGGAVSFFTAIVLLGLVDSSSDSLDSLKHEKL